MAVPTASFLLFAYQQEAMIEAAVNSALRQDGGPLEIILSDDASSDRTFEIMQRIASDYRGPHVVRARRSATNRGMVEHMHEVAAESSGELLILGAGDDISEPARARRLIEQWSNEGRVPSVVYSDFVPIDQAGDAVALDNENIYRTDFTLAKLALGGNGPLGATCAVTRDLFDDFPPVSASVTHEDRVLPFRALLLDGKICFVDEKLVGYRVSGGISRSSPANLSDYLHGYSRAYHTRTIEDARQRLADAKLKRPQDTKLLRACQATIADHEARLAMSDGRNLTSKFLRYLVKGARPLALAKHYLKFGVAAAGLR